MLRAAYPLTRLEAASRAVMTVRSARAADEPYAAHPAPDASGVVVEVAHPSVVPRANAAAVSGVPLELVTGRPRQPRGWDAVKWHDHTPFIGGDLLTTDGHSGWRALTSVGYSYRGDYVCHAGARSASKGHPTPCGSGGDDGTDDQRRVDWPEAVDIFRAFDLRLNPQT